MRKALMTMWLFCLAATATYADEQKSVKLSEEHPKEQVRLGYCNIFVTRVDTDDDGNSKTTVEIENLDETNVIILFGHAYPEKELKKLSPSITFDKIFPGTKGQREIDTYPEARNVVFIEPSEKSMLPEIQVSNGEVQVCRLPLYLAKYKGKSFLSGSNGSNKLLLIEKQIIELEIEVEVKPDVDFPKIETEINTFMENLDRQSFCNHTRHRPSLVRQEAPYKQQVERIKHEIDSIIGAHGWFTTDKGYQRYNGLKQKLDGIDFSMYEKDCGKHTIKYCPKCGKKMHSGPCDGPTSCKYCNLSPQQIYHKLDDYYKQIFSSNNRKATKEAVMSDVNLLYWCSKHSAAWKNSEYKSKIADRYNRISNF